MKRIVAALVALALTLGACGQSASSGDTTFPEGSGRATNPEREAAQPTVDLESQTAGANPLPVLPTADLENPPVGETGGPGVNTESPSQATPAGGADTVPSPTSATNPSGALPGGSTDGGNNAPLGAPGSEGSPSQGAPAQAGTPVVDNDQATTGDNAAGNTRLPGEAGTDQQTHSNPLDANPAPGNDPVAGSGGYPEGRANTGSGAATGVGAGVQDSTSSDAVSGTRLNEARNVIDIVATDGRFTILMSALRATQLDQELAQGGPYTLFAPTDEAWRSLPSEARAQLQRDPEALRALLLGHVADGAVFAPYDDQPSSATVGGGRELTMTVEDGAVIVGGEARVINPNIQAANGVVQVVNQVIGAPNVAVAQGGTAQP